MKIVTVALAFLLVQPVSAQERCAARETVNKCLSRLTDSPEVKAEKEASEKAVEDAKAEMTNEQWEQLIRKATGLSAPDLGLESATEDFLPLLRLAFAAAGLQDGLDQSSFNFERKIASFGANDSWELKLKGAMNDAEVFGPLKEAFDEEVREQRVSDLKAQFEDFDDYSLTLDLNRSSESYGRTPNAYSQEVFQDLLLRVVETSKSVEPFSLTETLRGLGVANAAEKKFEELNELEEKGQIPPGSVKQVEQAVLAEARGFLQTVDNLKKGAEDLKIFQVADLLNNQPQINGSSSYRRREGAAGPDEITVKASYEYGFVNLNRLRRQCGTPSKPRLSGNIKTFEECYSDFLEDSRVQAQMEHGDRFSITAEYNEVDAYKFSLPADQIDLNLDSQNGLVLTLAYARYIDLSVLGDSSSRIDITGKYESEDDRGVISLTYTNRLFQSLGGSIGISYANHERFLPDSDQVLSAHFGLSFNSFSKNPPKKNPPSTNTP